MHICLCARFCNRMAGSGQTMQSCEPMRGLWRLAYEVNDAAAVKNTKYISETKPTWSWSDKAPRD
jgi:hypothetical protein